MAEVALDLNLTADLLLDTTLLQLRLVKDLERTDETRGSLLGEVHTTKFALSEGLANFKHAQVERLGLIVERSGAALVSILVGVARHNRLGALARRGRNIHRIDLVLIGVLKSQLQ